MIKSSNSLFTISVCTQSDNDWLSIDETMELVKKIISNMTCYELEKIVHADEIIFENNDQYKIYILEKVFNLITPLKLNESYTCTAEHTYRFYDSTQDFEQRNCKFLVDLNRFMPETGSCKLWDNYLASRDIHELLALYIYDCISIPPAEVIEMIVNSISLKSVGTTSTSWYEKPILLNQSDQKVLACSKADIFTPIAHRLATMKLSPENIPIAVLLAEYMANNKPSGQGYSTWKKTFDQKLNLFVNENLQNSTLKIIIWATYFQTSGSTTALSNVFPYLPPYMQIRCVKKLFALIDLGKIQYSIDQLYSLIGGEKVCFPLAITFEYMKLRKNNPSARFSDWNMLQLIKNRKDHGEWIEIYKLLTSCTHRKIAIESNRKAPFNSGITIQDNVDCIKISILRKSIYYDNILEQINKSFSPNEYKFIENINGVELLFNNSNKIEIFNLSRTYQIPYNDVFENLLFINKDEYHLLCECRLAEKLDQSYQIPFYWCENKPCFRLPVRYNLSNEWEYYTILDFMRILNIQTDYLNNNGKKIKYGHYIILSSYFKNFEQFYEHLKCRECGELMVPKEISNFAWDAVNKFICINEKCHNRNQTIYLNHCFNRTNTSIRCNVIIDSRDSRQCPNGQYICPKCGACCSTQNAKNRLSRLTKTGGAISSQLLDFIKKDLGHWEKNEYFCYKCGKSMTKIGETYNCPECGTVYKKHKSS